MKRILSILLAILILISNFGFALGTHYCGGKIVKSELMLHQEDLHCGMIESQMTCNDHTKDGDILKNVCCENDYLTLDLDDNYTIYQSNIVLNTVFVLAPNMNVVQRLYKVIKNRFYCIPYKAPPILRSFQTLYQVFTI